MPHRSLPPRRPSVRQTLAANVNALIQASATLTTTIKLAKAAKLGNGTVGRIRQGTVGCSVDSLEAIAGCFGLDAWQLLVEGLDPKNPPLVRGVSGAERELYDKLDALLHTRALRRS